MKKNIILCSLVAIVASVAGYFTCLKVNTFSVESHNFMVELTDAQDEAINLANQVMWNNDLFDADGSDTMCDYLDAVAKVDSLWLEIL